MAIEKMELSPRFVGAGTSKVRLSGAGSVSTINACDAVAGWTNSGGADAVVLNLVTKKEGIGALDLGKSGVTVPLFYYTKDVTAFDATDKSVYVWLWIKDVATKNLLQSYGAAIVQLINAGTGAKYEKFYTRAQLSTGWNKLGGKVPEDLWLPNGSPDITAIDRIQIYLAVNDAATTVPSGDIIMDFWHLSMGERDITEVVDLSDINCIYLRLFTETEAGHDGSSLTLNLFLCDKDGNYERDVASSQIEVSSGAQLVSYRGINSSEKRAFYHGKLSVANWDDTHWADFQAWVIGSTDDD